MICFGNHSNSSKTGMMVLNGESPAARVKVTLQLGSETYSTLASNKGLISEQLASVKEQSMTILKDFITKHNIPNDIPDEPDEISSDDDEEASPKPPVKRSKNGQ